MATSVFITREVDGDSVFRQILEEKGFQVSGKSFIDFKNVQQVWSDPIDWVFFYSRSGVRHFGYHPYMPIKIAAMGTGTAAAAEKIGYKVDFIGNGEPPSVAKKFKAVAKNQRVLFPQGENSKQSIQKILDKAIIHHSLVVYQNSPMNSVEAVRANVLVFTSPLNVQAYCSKNSIGSDQKLIVIGETTKQALEKYTDCKIYMPDIKNEKGLALLVYSNFS